MKPEKEEKIEFFLKEGHVKISSFLYQQYLDTYVDFIWYLGKKVQKTYTAIYKAAKNNSRRNQYASGSTQSHFNEKHVPYVPDDQNPTITSVGVERIEMLFPSKPPDNSTIPTFEFCTVELVLDNFFNNSRPNLALFQAYDPITNSMAEYRLGDEVHDNFDEAYFQRPTLVLEWNADELEDWKRRVHDDIVNLMNNQQNNN